MTTPLHIGTRLIGNGTPVFIIAEAGVNHNGDLAIAKKLIDAAADAGADAVKFQTFTAELLVTKSAPQAEYQIQNTGKTESQFDMLKRLELPRGWHSVLQTYAGEKGLIFLSTPFSETDADFLETLNVPAFKIPSGEITNIPYLEHIARFGKPMIVSTGMATLEEVREAVTAIRDAGNDMIVVLHSTSNYPPSPASLNLLAIQTLRDELKKWSIPIGYSDNGTPGFIADVIAVALGACIVEKHFTVDKNFPGPDHRASLGPKELKDMINAIRLTEVMLGTGEKKPADEEASIAAVARKSIVAARDIPKGARIAREDITTRRPGTGLSPKLFDSLIGKKAARDIGEGSLIATNDYEE
ncbi:MAG: N-acetylneuraminate synthase [Patescibacteria group bacterium]